MGSDPITKFLRNRNPGGQSVLRGLLLRASSQHIKNTHLVRRRDVAEQSKLREFIDEALRAVRPVHEVVLTEVARTTLRTVLDALCYGFTEPG